MRMILSKLCLAGAATLATLPSSAQSGGPLVRGDVAERVDAYISRIAPLGFSGGVIIARDGELILSKAWGESHRAKHIAASRDTVFPLGSITKHFTAAAILRLQMDESLSVDDPIEFYFENVPPDKASITIHQLLTHSSGFAESSGVSLGAGGADEFVERAFASELAFAPGTDRSYSNIGYSVLAAIIERATDMTYEAALRELLFEPAGMTSTGRVLPEWRPEVLAHGYIDGADTGPLYDPRVPDLAWGATGSGGLMTTLDDMLKWNVALDEQSVLDANAIEQMMNPKGALGERGGTGYGCGVSITARGTRLVGHNGSNDVFSADFRRYPDEGVLIFAAGNNADAYSFDLTPTIEALVFGAKVELPPATIKLAPDALAKYVGDWRLPTGDVVRVGIAGAALEISSSDAEAAGWIHPVPDAQVFRRGQLRERVVAAFALAFEGDMGPLRELLDPYAPADEFDALYFSFFEDWIEANGEFDRASAIPGRNRFGEIALIAILEFERGRAMIEYSFAREGIGSVRFMNGFPTRAAFPESPESFIAYDIGSGDSWRVHFRVDADGTPTALLLTTGADSNVEAVRVANAGD